MSNYQDSNALANIFCEFVSQNVNKLLPGDELCVFYIQLNVMNKKNLEIYGFDVATQIIQKITRQILDSTFDESKSFCFTAMDEFILVTRGNDESLSGKVFELCNRFYISPDEYIEIPVYIGSQIVTEKITEPLRFLHKLLINEVHRAESVNQNLLSNKIRNARYLREQLMKRKMVFAYQPVFHLQSNKTEYYECLMRMQTEDDFSSIVDFIEAAEELQLGPLIDRVAFDLMKETVTKYPDKKFSFNLTASVIENRDLIEEIISFIKNQAIAQRILVEVTETSRLISLEETRKFIDLLHRHNVQFVIDDFGSGYTSFHQLKDLAVDIVKIDGSFIRDLLTDKVSQNFVKSVVNICQEKNIKVVCEFVENEEVCRYLSNLGVHYMQGYYFGQPSLFI